MAGEKITLGANPATGEGGVEVDVYAQRHAYLTRRIGKFFDELTGELASEDNGELDVGDIAALTGEQGYKITVALIPQLEKRMSLWDWQGFASREAMQAGELMPEAESLAPSVPEIRHAIATAARVNGLDMLGVIKGVVANFVDPRVLRPLITEKVADLIDSISMTSSSSPSASGGSPASTSSGPTSPTSTESTGSRSLALSGSSAPGNGSA